MAALLILVLVGGTRSDGARTPVDLRQRHVQPDAPVRMLRTRMWWGLAQFVLFIPLQMSALTVQKHGFRSLACAARARSCVLVRDFARVSTQRFPGAVPERPSDSCETDADANSARVAPLRRFPRIVTDERERRVSFRERLECAGDAPLCEGARYDFRLHHSTDAVD